MKKVKLSLTPYTALAILKFVREYINEETKGKLGFKAIQDACDEYEQEIYKRVDDDQLEDALIENSINKMTGKWPTVKNT